MLRNFLYFSIAFVLAACNRTGELYTPIHAPFLQADASWADSVLQQMDLEEKVGQLLLWAPEEGLGTSRDSLWQNVAAGKIGGLLIEKLSVDSFLYLIDSSQHLSKCPLLIGSRENVLLNNQFSNAIPFPLAATLSSIHQDSLLEQLEDRYVNQCEALGINFCFAPSLNRNEREAGAYDFRCYKNEHEPLLWHSTRVMHKLQKRKVLAVAHDFKDLLYIPGDTSHILDSILQPYLNLSLNGLSGVLSHPVVFEEDTSMFKPLDYLKNYGKRYFDFGGLHFAKTTSVATIEKQFLAGVDLFLIADSLETYTNRLLELVQNGFLSERMLNEKVFQILRAKSWIKNRPEEMDSQREQVIAELNDKGQELFRRQLYESSVILAQNKKQLLPFSNLTRKKFRIVQIGHQKLSRFLKEFDHYAASSHRWLPLADSNAITPLDPLAFKNKTLILTLDSLDLTIDQHTDFIASVKAVAEQGEVALINFGNPYNLQFFDTTLTLIQITERNPLTEAFAVQTLFGASNPKGYLPVAVSENLPLGHGEQLEVTRLQYAAPEEVGIAAYKLVGIDAIARSAIAKGATPGCQVMVIKDGKVIYDKSFGHQSKNRRRKVATNDLYDVASITKVAATTLAMMKLYEEGKIKINDRLSKHLEMGEKSPLRRLTLKQLLTHKSGLQSHMPINPYVMARDSSARDCQRYFCDTYRPPFTIPIADSFFMDHHYLDTIWQDVYQLKPRRRKRFRYSDVNFALLHKAIEEKTGKDFDAYLKRKFYQPLHLRHLGFRPLEKFPATAIIPTARDEKWRKQLLHGYVHDETAALLNGVAGNAGLFSNAGDLAILFQMLLNGGTYGGKRYLKPETIDLFTKTQYKSKRGLGFDKKNKSKSQACSPKASSSTYGHTGFTGTCVWVDPKEELIYIFLANRINETTKNKRIFRDRVRRRIHTVIYDALDSADQPLESVPKLKSKSKLEKVSRAEALSIE